MAQQTAIEWFFLWFIDNPKGTHEEYLEAYDKAKAMEKEQMYQVWKTSEEWSDGKLLDSKKSFEEYYNETYNK
jgi:hypothetical protein